MRKFQNFIFPSFPKLITALAICSLVLAGFDFPSQAKTPTPPPTTPTPEVTPEEKPTPKTDIEVIREEVKKKVREKIEEIKKGKKLAYAGEISQISDNLVTITGKAGEYKITVSEETKIVGKKKATAQLKDLQIGDFIIAMGYIQEDGSLGAKRIVVVEKPKLPARQVAFGKVTDISVEEKILTVRNEKKGTTYTVLINNKTIITKKTDTGIEKAKFSDMEKGDWVVAIGTPSENEKRVITAKIIHVIPGKALGPASATGKQEKPTASPTPKTAQE